MTDADQPQRLDRLPARLADRLGDIQAVLDAQTARDMALWCELADRTNGSALARDIAGQIQPEPLRLSQVHLQIDVDLKTMQSSAGNVSLNVAGLPVSAFRRSRFAGKSSNSRIEMVCQAVTIAPTDTVQPDQARETSDG